MFITIIRIYEIISFFWQTTDLGRIIVLRATECSLHHSGMIKIKIF